MGLLKSLQLLVQNSEKRCTASVVLHNQKGNARDGFVFILYDNLVVMLPAIVWLVLLIGGDICQRFSFRYGR